MNRRSGGVKSFRNVMACSCSTLCLGGSSGTPTPAARSVIFPQFAIGEVHASAIDGPDAVAQVFHRAQEAIFLRKFEKAIKRLK